MTEEENKTVYVMGPCLETLANLASVRGVIREKLEEFHDVSLLVVGPGKVCSFISGEVFPIIEEYKTGSYSFVMERSHNEEPRPLSKNSKQEVLKIIGETV